MPLIEIYHRSTEGWSRYEPSRNGYEQITGPADHIEDAPEPGYYLLAGGESFAGPFASLDAAKERLDIEMRYRDAVEKYERARDGARDALFEVAAVLAVAVCSNPLRRSNAMSGIVYDWDAYCDSPMLMPSVPETASDYLDQD